MLLLPLISFFFLISAQVGTAWDLNFLGFDLVPFKVDRLSLVFGYIFHLISLIGIIYTLSIRSDLEYTAGLVYAGSALGAVFAGDLFTFFVFWEMLTVSALWLIWARRTKASQAAGFRYLMVHVFGGLVLLAGIIMYISEQQSISLGFIGLHSPDQRGLAPAAFLVDRRLPGIHSGRRCIFKCLYNKNSCVCPGQDLPRHRAPYLDRCGNGPFPDLLRCH
jgi:formate hydrogenlyase subunit 3/multisubunit Na+/H+ antiporter MnhD subunit